MNNPLENAMSGMFGKISPGCCRLSMNGGIAVKTSSGYKTYNVKTGRLTNCNSFVMDIADDFFFVIPTNKVEKGDIILVNGAPKCVIEVVNKNEIKVMNYNDSTIDTIVPERHIFMGNTYFYGKIVSMFGKNLFKGKKGTNKILQYMMMSEMFKGSDDKGGLSSMLPFMMMNGNGFSDMFDMFGEDDEDEDSTDILNAITDEEEE